VNDGLRLGDEEMPPAAKTPVGLTPEIGASSVTARVLAFYLPQFHPVPENDIWWGKGFTEWHNVTRARPLFRSHRQPHLPADLGFYDLRVAETRKSQAELARSAGVSAFCYWHYWFAGQRLLETPFSQVLRSGEPNFPFCLAWANQTWTGIWHGAAERVLIEQTYPGPEDDRAHFESVLEAFEDPRYLRVNGRPLLYIFRPEELPDPPRFVERWQEMAVKAGLRGLYLVAEVSDLLGDGVRYREYRRHGFDAGVYVRIPVLRTPRTLAAMRLRRRLRGGPEVFPCSQDLPDPPLGLDAPLYPCVYPNWDNTPRCGRRGVVVVSTGPERFRAHIRAALDRIKDRDAEERLLFVKSWNEWAEGNYLEPDQETGLGYLDVLHEEVSSRQ
jgi:lipopolysaccharide biosynthesis protein